MRLYIIVGILLSVIDAQVIQPAAVSRAFIFPQFPQSVWQMGRQGLSNQQPVYPPDDLQQLYAQNLLLTRGCPTRPPGCSLNCGDGGFAWGLGTENGSATCLCVCQSSGCSSTSCAKSEVCVNSVNSTKCISSGNIHFRLGQNGAQSLTPICPLLQGGACRQRCRVDADCHKEAGASLAQLRPFLHCCANGCGRECVLASVSPSSSGSIVIVGAHTPLRGINSIGPPSQPITPLRHNTNQHQQHAPQKSGVCPSSILLRPPSDCAAECEVDSECKGAEKCCKSGCGRICTAPEKTNNCVHLLSAIERLPARSLINGFVPSCSPRGSFNPVQCDLESCWCVTSETGSEIYGTKRPRHERSLFNCKDIFGCEAAVERCARKSRKCPLGFRTDENGCPQADCICRNLCDSILCDNAADECQLVEPDCARPPCEPVPKCLLNPCPSGSPMKLANGVTGLCREPSQCWDGYWCHQIGYNGLGFCCSLPQSRSHIGACPAHVAGPRTVTSVTVHSIRSTTRSNCSSECRSDEECPSPGKCCFDGCGLKCVFDFGAERAIDQIDSSTGGNDAINDATEEEDRSQVQTANKELLSAYPKLAKCPAESRLRAMRRQHAECNECQTDAECPGLQLCCSVTIREERNGVASSNNASECHICVYSQSTTKCLHNAITHDFYGRRETVGGILTLPPRCAAPFGDYAPVQCNSKYCFCVDKLNGIEIAGTRKYLEDGPITAQQCEQRSNSISACTLRQCDNVESCASGEFLRDEKGCVTCECVNTCANLQCQNEEVCILAKVDCVGAHCARQPRCVANFCPNGGRPFIASTLSASTTVMRNEDVTMTVAAEQCSRECPTGYQCRHIGLPGEGGICCPELKANVDAVDTMGDSLDKCAQQSILLLPRDNRLCAMECRVDADCSGLAELGKCCFNGCGTRCVASAGAVDVIRLEATKAPTTPMRPVAADEDERPGECVIPRSRVYRAPSNDRCALQSVLLGRHRAHGVATLRPPCVRDADCAPFQKCCLEACTGRRQCQFAHKNTACLHLKSAYLQSGAGDLAMNVRCTNEGQFAPIQCDGIYCWCVDKATGSEIEGTRSESSQLPNCREPRKCSGQRCTTKVCIHGFEKDENGCDTCECANPCKRLKCPEKLGLICIPQQVECLSSHPSAYCPYVPKCVPNVCSIDFASGADAILIRKGTFRPETCDKSSDCPPDYHCRQLGGHGGVCCFGQEPTLRPGQCPVLHDWALGSVEPEFCELQCSIDASCTNRAEKCCFNGCGLSCMPAIHVADQREVQHSDMRPVNGVVKTGPSDWHQQISGPKPGECPRVESSIVPCSTKLASLVKRCSDDSDCADTQKCCTLGCKGMSERVCQFPAVATRCQHTRAAAMLILKAQPNNIFMPKCAPNGDFEELQRHTGVAWCVDSQTGREVQGTKSATLLLVSCANDLRAKSCPILACSLDCPYGFETDLLGCQLCACKNPCRDVRCGPSHICYMTKVACVDGPDPHCHLFVPRCTLNACPAAEPLQDATTRRFFECDERAGRSCPPGWFCHTFGLEAGGYCCAGSANPATRARSRRCPSVAPILAIGDGTPKLPFVGLSRGPELTCRISDDCRATTNDDSCCFNGHDMSCVALNKDSNQINTHIDEASIFGPINDHVDYKSQEPDFLGVCPANVPQTTDCRSDCASDADCQRRNARMRCCAFGCARRCQLTAHRREADHVCLQMLTAIIREADKLFAHDERDQTGASDAAADRVAHFVAQNEVQCASDGTFKPIQCNNRLRQCWCVNVETGAETPGTHTNISDAATLNCRQPRLCRVNCAHEQKSCALGIRMDVSGCPLNDACVCAQPCDRFTCARSGDICILSEPSSKCGLGIKCMPRPECVQNPCGQRSRIANLNDPRTCSSDEDCDTKAKCEFHNDQQKSGICCRSKKEETTSSEIADAVAITLPMSRDAGVCPGALGVNDFGQTALPAGEFSSPIQPAVLKLYEQKQFCTARNECDSDADCAKNEGTKKCCTVGGSSRCRRRACVQPFRATNCVNMLAAIMELQRRHVLHNLYTPYCDTQNANYRSNQCDDSEGWCWCVDVTTGRPILGTRTFQPTFNVCTLAKQHKPQCAITCDDETRCPFGVEMDKSGCPRSAQCRCRSPCIDVRCGRGEICVMRSRPCQEDTCLPVPVCEANPCQGKQESLKAPNLGERAPISCSVIRENSANSDFIRACPVNHYCAAADNNGIGICCAGKEVNATIASKSTVHVENAADSVSKTSVTSDVIAACLNGKTSHTLPSLMDYFRRPSLIVDSASNSNEVDSEDRGAHCDNDAQCATTHFCGRIESGKGICCPSSQFVCQQSMNAGYGSGIAGCREQTNARFYFDRAINSCIQFIYGGCGGNLNNFMSNSDCEAFCLDNPLHDASSAERRAENIIYTVGFQLQGPLRPAWKQNDDELQKFQKTLRDYIKRNVGDAIKDIHVADNGTVFMVFSSGDSTAARRVAHNAVDSVMAGEFRLRFHDALYSAIPDSVSSRQSNALAASAGEKLWNSSESDALFWIIAMATLLFALAIVIIACSTYNCIRSRSRAHGEIASPTSYESRTSPQITTAAMGAHTIEHSGSYSAAATSRLNVISLPRQPQTHLLTISNYNSEQTASEEARVGINCYAPSQLLLTPAVPKTIRAPPPPSAATSNASTSSTETDARFIPQSRHLRRAIK